MKTTLQLKTLFILLCFISMYGFGQISTDDFVTTWKTDNTGTSNDTSITIPTTGNGYNYDVDWDNDGTFDETGITGNITHDFGTPGTYTIRIKGTFPQIYFNGELDKDKILSVDQWGTNPWASMGLAFRGCSNFNGVASDAPDLTNVTNMGSMFFQATSFNQNINSWDVSSVTAMYNLFYNAFAFNQPLNNWNVSNVTDTGYMFYNATSFNQDISNWTLFNALYLTSMFENASVFNQNLGSWQIPSIINALKMFDNSGLSIPNYDATLTGWKNNPITPDNLSLGSVGLQYCTSNADRQYLITTKGWTITGDQKLCETDFYISFNEQLTEAIIDDNNHSITVVVNNNLNLSNLVASFTVFTGATVTVNSAAQVSGATANNFSNPVIYTVTSPDSTTSQNWQVTLNTENCLTAFPILDSFETTNSVGYQDTDDTLDWTVQSGVTPSTETGPSAAKDGNYYLYTEATRNSFKTAILTSKCIDLTSLTAPHLNFWYHMYGSNMGSLGIEATIDNGANWTEIWSKTGDQKNKWNEAYIDLTTYKTSTTIFRIIGNTGNSFRSDMAIDAISIAEFVANTETAITEFSLPTQTESSSIDAANQTIAIEVPNGTDLTAMVATFALSRGATASIGSTLQTSGATPNNFTNPVVYTILAEDATTTQNWTVTVSYPNPINDFVTTWKTDNPENSNDTSITIPTNSNATYNYDVDWDNDGTFDETGITGNVTHDFGTPGTYTIRIRGAFPQIYFNGELDKDKILSVDQWGTNPWTSMNSAFYGCSNLNGVASDLPNLSNVTNMDRIYSRATSFNQPLNNWDVSNVISMYAMFGYASSFNQPLNNWDVSKVTSMGFMFDNTTSFNQPLNNWDVSNVINMGTMFQGASNFNQNLSGWDVSKVTDMDWMFNIATSFNQDISTWDVSNVTNMYAMFQSASNFNQNLSAWDVSKVTDMGWMFNNATSFNQDISTWDVSSVTNMYAMFQSASNFNQNLSAWNLTAVTSMENMLNNSGLSLANYDATLTGWKNNTNTPNTITLGATGLNYCAADTDRQELISTKGWTITGDAKYCGATTPFVTTWKTDNPGTSNDTSITIPTTGNGYNYDVDWDNDGTFDETGITGNVTHDFGTAGTYTIRIRGAFPRIYFNNELDKEKILAVDQWGDNAWTSMNRAFYGCSNLTNVGNDIPNLSNVTDMSTMFYGAISFNQDLNNWDVSNVANMDNMFGFTSVFNGNISSWDVSNVTSMRYMFNYAITFNQNISTWDVSSVKNMFAMFKQANVFDQSLANWNVSNVTDMGRMFDNSSSFNQDINSWDVISVTSMFRMFIDATAFNQSLTSWNLTAVTSMENMLNNSGLSLANYDATLTGWKNNTNTPNTITLGATGLNYCAADTDRQELISTKGWIITGDARYCGAADDFVTTWKTDNAGTSNDTSITIPTTGNGYNYDLDWDNDGTFDQIGITENVTHDFGTAGTYTIRIRGKFPQIYFDDQFDKDKILSVDQWGSNIWTSMRRAFYGCSNLTNVGNDIPNLTNVTDMAIMFFRATSFNQDINNWDVSSVTNMSQMFLRANSFNQALNNWDVSGVTNMSYMFYGTSSFNQPLNSWDVSKVTDMSWMFYDTSSFNQDINSWDVSSVINMGNMFQSASSFNQSLTSWNLAAVTTMENMLNNSGLSLTNYDATLTGWKNNANTPNTITLGATGLNYCAAETDRQELIDTKSWTITGDARYCGAADDFVTTWKTDNAGTSSDTSITIPTSSNATYNYDVDWDNDRTFDEIGITGNVTHDFGTAGTYTIRIRGKFPQIYFFGELDKDKILAVDQWGTNPWTSMELAFAQCSNFNGVASDMPNLSNVTSMFGMFTDAVSFNQPLNNWDVSNVTDMGALFANATSFNQNINDWDVSNVTNMRAMFEFALDFNQPLNNWDVSNVSDMAAMLLTANSFNQNINSWDVSSVTNMGGMFFLASSFNQPLNNWDVSSVTRMASMFSNASSFDQEINNWDVSKVTNMQGMFTSATTFNQSLATWNLTAVTTMENMLNNTGLSLTNYDATLTGWKNNTNTPSSITLGATGLNYCASETDRQYLIDTKGWTIIGDTKGCITVPTDHFVTTWKTDNAGTSSDTSITIPTSSNATYNYDVDWDNDGTFDEIGITGNVTHDFGTAGTYTIRIRGKFPRIYFNNELDKDKILSVDQWGTNSWTSMRAAFYGCSNFNGVASDVPNLSNVNEISSMFFEASSFNQDISSWDVSNVEFMNDVFSKAIFFNQDLNNWDVSIVTSMGQMFAGATNFNKPLNNWDVSNVTNMDGMFREASSFNQNINNWNVSNVTDMRVVFINASSYNQPLNNWNVSNVTDMNYMFNNAISFNQPLNNWNVSSVTRMQSMFDQATAFDHSLASWSLTAVTKMERMLNSSGLSLTNYDATLTGWKNNTNTPNNITLGATGINYCAAETDRQYLIDTKGWTIIGDSVDCSSLGLEDALISNAIKLYPNPTKDYITIEGIENISNITLYNIQGQKINYEMQNNKINLISKPSGIYLLKIESEKGIVTKKIIKE